MPFEFTHLPRRFELFVRCGKDRDGVAIEVIRGRSITDAGVATDEVVVADEVVADYALGVLESERVSEDACSLRGR